MVIVTTTYCHQKYKFTFKSLFNFGLFSFVRCENVLSEFLRSIKQDPGRVDFAGMINILISHSQATDDLVQVTYFGIKHAFLSA